MSPYSAALAAAKLAARKAAGLVGRSPTALRLLRAVPVPGKHLVVHRLPAGSLPRSVTATAGGFTYDFDLDDLLHRSIYFNAYERADLRTALARCPEGGTCLDAGAAIGYFTLHLARKAGPGGRVHAFEPNPANFERLQRHCAANGVKDRVVLNRTALSDRAGSAAFHRHPGASADGTLEEFGTAWASTETVETDTIDAYLERHAISQVDLAKVDVEGHELKLLQGAAASLERRAIKAMLIEFNGGRLAEQGVGLADLIGALERFGYRPAGKRLLLRLLERGRLDATRISVNFLFLPAGR